MSKSVVVIASGETERRALPRLVAHLEASRGCVIDGVRIPPRHARLDVRMAARLIKAAWFEDPQSRPDKFVVLVDVDAADPTDVLRPFEIELPQRVRTPFSTPTRSVILRHGSLAMPPVSANGWEEVRLVTSTLRFRMQFRTPNST